MKTRSDFVSNSSSSSFVVKTNVQDAVKMFLDDFGKSIIENGSYGCCSLGESFNVGFKKADDEGWFTWLAPYDFVMALSKNGNDSNVTYDDGYEDSRPDIKLEDISELSFECDDYDNASMASLALLYKYFSVFGFSPDDSETEKDFKSTETFMTKIVDRLASN